MIGCTVARGLGALLSLSLMLAACGAGASTPTGIIVQVIDTATVPAINLPTYDPDFSPSATVPSELATQTPTDSPVQTKTPLPETPNPTATGTRPAGRPGPTATLPARLDQAPDTSAFGIVATFGLEADKSAYTPGEQVWFNFTLTNLKAVPLAYGEVGVILPNGSFHPSLSGSSLSAHESLPWRDWVSFSASGDQPLILAVCLATVDECRTGGTWVNLSAPVVVKIN